MGILEDLISVDDVGRLIALHCGPHIVILVSMDLVGGGMASINMGRVVKRSAKERSPC